MEPSKAVTIIEPLNVVGATIVIQLLIIFGIALSAVLVRHRFDSINSALRGRDKSYWGRISLPILCCLIFSIFILMLTDVMYSKVWGNLFQGLSINTISPNAAVLTVFIVDIILTGYFIYHSGGSDESPGSPILLTIPALAIFLRLSPDEFITLAIVSALVFISLNFTSRKTNTWAEAKISRTVIGLYCLFISMLTGYITKPLPM